MLCIVSDFAFLTRFFVLIIVSHFSVSSMDNSKGEGGYDVMVARPKQLQIPENAASTSNAIVIMSPVGVGGHDFMIFLRPVTALEALPRTFSGCLSCFEQNPEEWRDALKFLSYVNEKKRAHEEGIKIAQESLDREALRLLTDLGFCFQNGSTIVFASEDAVEARMNNYRWLHLVFEMTYLAVNKPDTAKKYLNPDITFEDHARCLIQANEQYKKQLMKIKESQAILSKGRDYLPEPKPTNPSFFLDDIG